MGGAIALRATALYPELISGLISSVPSGDRYNEMGQGFKIGMHVLLGGGMNKPMNIGDTIVKQATKKDDLRETWSQDPDGKMNLTPAELIHFQSFMKENLDAAKTYNYRDLFSLFKASVTSWSVLPEHGSSMTVSLLPSGN